MGYLVVNHNVVANHSHLNTQIANSNLDEAIAKLSSGKRINKSEDDSSGMAIADNLRAQVAGLNKAGRNTNDAIGVVQIADKAMEEQIRILDRIKAKAAQSAQDGQGTLSRMALQKEIERLIEQLDNIAEQTSYNGLKLLSGNFINKEFHVGAYTNETIKTSIASTHSNKIGGVRFETTATLTAATETKLTFRNPTGGADITIESTIISTSAKTGLKALAENINKHSNEIGVRATYHVQSTSSRPVGKGRVEDLRINGILIGSVEGIGKNDETGTLQNAINAKSLLTGVRASTDAEGKLHLTSDGRGIKVTSGKGGTEILGLGRISSAAHENYGRLSLVQTSTKNIIYRATGAMENVINSHGTEGFANLASVLGKFSSPLARAAGGFANSVLSAAAGEYVGVGVTTFVGAMMTMDIADSALKTLDRIRADIGAVQNQLQVTFRNVTSTSVNVKSSESDIRDLDFGLESTNFTKHKILAQSGSFAMAQANVIQENVLRLLQ